MNSTSRRVARRVPSDTWYQLQHSTTASITSELLDLGYRNTFMRGVLPLNPPRHMVGYAFTLRYIPSREDLDFRVDFDNLTNVQRLAVEEVGADDVLVIDARGELSAASFGHILATRIMRRGAAGLVTDGALRDSHRIKELELPSYSAGVHGTVSSVRHHPVDMNMPVACGGVAVFPGDVLVGDAEGVVVIPIGVAESVARDACERDVLEEYLQGRVDKGDGIVGVYPPDEKTLAEYRTWEGGNRS